LLKAAIAERAFIKTHQTEVTPPKNAIVELAPLKSAFAERAVIKDARLKLFAYHAPRFQFQFGKAHMAMLRL
jgi:hypothetical protein